MALPSKIFSKYNVWTILSVLSFVIAMCFVSWTRDKMIQSGIENFETQKKIKSDLAIISFRKELDKFALLVLGIRNQIKSIDRAPSALELQSLLRAQLNGMNFHDSLVISYIDTNHVFQYSVTSTTINANDLVGESVAALRDSVEISNLNNLMNTENLILFPPINLVEGWVGIPLNFRLQKGGTTVGYFAPIIDFKTIIDEIYQQQNADDFVYKFSYNEGILFDRHAVYNGTKIYNSLEDTEFYQNFDNLEDDNFIDSSFSHFGVDFNIGLAHKEVFRLSNSQSLLLSSWYFTITLFFVISRLFSFWQRKRNKDLKLQREQLISYNEALQRFTYAASHDLKEPLRTIGSFSSLLQKRYQNVLDDKGKEYLGLITSNISRMYNLQEDLLKYSQVVNANEIPKEKVAFRDIIIDVKESVHASLIKGNTKLSVDDDFPYVNVNRLQIHQVLQNLLSNAIKFNDKKECQIHIGFKILNGMSVFLVRDNGIGIKKEFHHLIFDAFQQLNKRDFGGSGLGMAICKKIISQHDGEIWLESEIGKGTTFYFSLPSII